MFRMLVLLTGLVALSAGAAARAQEVLELGKSSAAWLKILAEAKEPKHKLVALIALERYGPKTKGVLPGLEEALYKDPSPAIRKATAETLARMGEDAKSAIPALANALARDKSELVREAAARALGGAMVKYSKTAVPVLAEALADPDPATRAAVAETLKDLGAEARPALRHLLAVLKDTKTDRFTRLYALQILGRFTEDAAVVVPALLAAFAETGAHPSIRLGAAESLARLGPEAAAAAPALAETLTSKTAPAPLRRACAQALVKVGADAKTAWPAAKVALTDPDASVRTQAIRLAGAMGKLEREVVPALVTRCEDENVEARLAAIQELGQLGAAAKGAEDTLRRLARSDSRASVRDAASAALTKIQAAP
jgi:HEAT repeat protein